MSRRWTCDTCDESFYSNAQVATVTSAIVTSQERLTHMAECSDSKETAVETKRQQLEDKQREAMPPTDPSLTAYKCADCKTVLYLKPIDILKHKRSHLTKNE